MAGRESKSDNGAPGDVAPMASSLLIRAAEPVATRLAVPRVWAVADDRLPRLEWRAETVHHVDATWETLAEFIKLATADLPSIEAFAQQWGVLGVDEAGRPGPPPGSSPIPALTRLVLEYPERRHDLMMAWARGDQRTVNEWFEPLSAWHDVASRFRAILHLAADRQGQRASNDGDIEAVLAQPIGITTWLGQHDRATGPDPDPDVVERQYVRPVGGESAETRRDQVVEDAINALLRTFPFQLRFTARAEGPPRLEAGLDDTGGAALADATQAFPRDWAAYAFPGPSLYPTLVLQLAMAVWWPAGLLRCSWCTNPFPQPAERAPRRDRATFCSSTCRMASKMANDRERARQRYARRGSTVDVRPQE